MSHLDPRSLEKLAAAVVEQCIAAGASEAECYAEAGHSTSASVEQNELKAASVAEHQALGIRVFVDRKMGFAYVNRTDSSSLRGAVEDAMAIAKASPPDEANQLLTTTAHRSVGGLYDERMAALGVNDAIGLVEAMHGAASTHKAVSIDNGSCSISTGATALVNSRGLVRSDQDSAITWALFGMAVENGEASGFDALSSGSRSLDDVQVAATGKRFAQRVLALRKPKAAKAYRGAVLFAPEAVAEIFLEPLLESLDGDAVWKRKSVLAHLRAQRIAAPGFTLIDDGTIAGALGSAGFDREGLPHQRMVLVGDGVLHRFLYDVKTSIRASVPPTGHASGSARSIPSIGTTNLTLLGGDASDAQLLRKLGTGLEVGRFSGTVDAVSGDYSGVAKGSFWVKNGARAWPVQETLIAGNVYRDLPNIIARSQHVEAMMTTHAPSLLVDGINVTVGG
jgi:PmbA protein